MTKTLRNLNAGDRVEMSYGRATRSAAHQIDCLFLGFSDDAEKYGEPGPAFANFEALKKAKGYTSFTMMDDVLDKAGRPYGYGIYAWFQEQDADGKITRFYAYRFEGGWVVGSSANRISLR